MQTYFGVSVRAGYSHRVRKPVVNWQFAPYWTTLNIQFCERLPLQIQGAYWVSNHLCEAWRHLMIKRPLCWSAWCFHGKFAWPHEIEVERISFQRYFTCERRPKGLDFNGLLTEYNICFMQIGGNEFWIFMSRPIT